MRRLWKHVSWVVVLIVLSAAHWYIVVRPIKQQIDTCEILLRANRSTLTRLRADFVATSARVRVFGSIRNIQGGTLCPQSTTKSDRP